MSAADWWGNTGYAETLDATDKAIRIVLPKGQKFGPTTW